MTIESRVGMLSVDAHSDATHSEHQQEDLVCSFGEQHHSLIKRVALLVLTVLGFAGAATLCNQKYRSVPSHDISKVTGSELQNLYSNGSLRLLGGGCPGWCKAAHHCGQNQCNGCAWMTDTSKCCNGQATCPSWCRKEYHIAQGSCKYCSWNQGCTGGTAGADAEDSVNEDTTRCDCDYYTRTAPRNAKQLCFFINKKNKRMCGKPRRKNPSCRGRWAPCVQDGGAATPTQSPVPRPTPKPPVPAPKPSPAPAPPSGGGGSSPNPGTQVIKGHVTMWATNDNLIGAQCEYANSPVGSITDPVLPSYLRDGFHCAIGDSNPGFDGGKHCGKCYRLVSLNDKGTSGTPGKKGSAIVMVSNGGAGGPNHFDCIMEGFQAITGANTGIFDVEFQEAPCQKVSGNPVVINWADKNAHYCKMMFENIGGWGSLEKVRACIDGTKCKDLNRFAGATWTGCPQGTGNSISFELQQSPPDGPRNTIQCQCPGAWPWDHGHRCTCQTNFPL